MCKFLGKIFQNGFMEKKEKGLEAGLTVDLYNLDDTAERQGEEDDDEKTGEEGDQEGADTGALIAH